MPKRNKNLSLEEEAIERGEIYSSMHNTNVSALVNEFLSRLPVKLRVGKVHPSEESDWLPPTVSRLLGVAAGDPEEDPIEDYHNYLMGKYGSE
jgi:hypothetical protein